MAGDQKYLSTKEFQMKVTWNAFLTALLGPLNAVIIFLVILLVFLPFDFLPPVWISVALGLFGVSALTYFRFTDTQSFLESAREELLSKYDLKAIHDPGLRNYVLEALPYLIDLQKQQKDLLKRGNSVFQNNLDTSIRNLDAWITYMVRLAIQLDAIKSNTNLIRSPESLQQEIAAKKLRLTQYHGTRSEEEINRTIIQLEEQLKAVEVVVNNINSSEEELQRMLSAIQTIYTQHLSLNDNVIDLTLGNPQITKDIEERIDRLNIMIDQFQQKI